MLHYKSTKALLKDYLNYHKACCWSISYIESTEVVLPCSDAQSGMFGSTRCSVLLYSSWTSVTGWDLSSLTVTQYSSYAIGECTRNLPPQSLTDRLVSWQSQHLHRWFRWFIYIFILNIPLWNNYLSVSIPSDGIMVQIFSSVFRFIGATTMARKCSSEKFCNPLTHSTKCHQIGSLLTLSLLTATGFFLVPKDLY